MEINTSRVYRSLETNLKIVGIDLFDLLICLLLSGVMNLIFGGTFLGIYIVFIFPGIVLSILHFGKRNKPEGFLKHYLRWMIMDEFLSAGQASKNRKKRKGKIYE